MTKAEETVSLIEQIQKGNSAAFSRLTEQYMPLVRQKVSSFSRTTVLGASEREDLEQEAVIALYKAAMQYDLTQTKVTFGLYAKICINNKLISLKRKTERSREKRSSTVKREQAGVVRGSSADGEAIAELLQKADSLLTPLERNALKLYISGMRYKDIASRLGTDRKTVDNALTRGKRKLKGYAEKKSGMNGNTAE